MPRLRLSILGCRPLFLLAIGACLSVAHSAEEKTIRIGYFPNITHAHALIAQNMAKEGEGWFEQRIPGISIKWHPFNAGPSAMESLFAKAIDISYVGPNPVLNVFVKSRGGVAVISGAVRGGAGLVVQPDSTLREPKDFIGKHIATPQLGNTQDIACRYWLTNAGLRITLAGGEVKVVPTENSSMLPLFVSKQIDAAWTVEPWLSRLELDANATLAYLEPAETSIVAVLSASEVFLRKNRDLASAIITAHHELTEWITSNPDEAQRRVTDELTRQTRRSFPHAITRHAWPRLLFDNAITMDDFKFSLNAAQKVGFLRGDHDISGLVYE